MNELIGKIDSFVWGPFTIVLLVGTGIFITILVRAIQVRKFVYGWKLLSGKYDNPKDEGEITHFQALSAALSATIGTGTVSYTHLRAHETDSYLVCRLLLEKQK